MSPPWLLVGKKNTLEISEGVLCSPSPPPQPASRLGVGEKKEKKIVLQRVTGLGKRKPSESRSRKITVNQEVVPQNMNQGPSLRARSVFRTQVTPLQMANNEPSHR